MSQLQWSHVFSDMVRYEENNEQSANRALQWSHVFSDMVRQRRFGVARHPAVASMEPCLFRHGKAARA